MRHNFGLVRYRFNPTGLRIGAFAALALLVSAQAATAQEFRMPSTLRYGSGLLDIPVAWVLPHMAITGTYSGFSLSVDKRIIVKQDGTELDKRGDAYSKWVSDGSIAIGLMNRVELGASIQHFDSEENGGNMLGAFARISLLPASMDRLGLAAGARFVTSPSYGAGSDYGSLQPGRLGYPDYRLLKSPSNQEVEGVSSNLSPYVVATARALTSEKMDLTLTGGWGMGMFSSGGDLNFYSETATGGVFGGAALHLQLGGGRLLNVMAEHNGFDLNAGVQLDMGNVRIGGFLHGLMGDGESTYRSQRFGILASLSLPNRTEVVIQRDTMVTADTAVSRDTVITADTTITTHTLADADRATLEEMVLFAFDRSAITDEAQPGLMAKVEVMRGDPGITLLIKGHADERGNSTYNTRLGQRRADAVLDFFTGEDRGLDAARFTVESRGEDDPLDPRPTPVGTPSRNRRVDFDVTGFTESADTGISTTHTITETTTVTETTTITETETVLTTRIIGKADTVSTETRTVDTSTRTSESTDTVGVETSAAAADARAPGRVAGASVEGMDQHHSVVGAVRGPGATAMAPRYSWLDQRPPAVRAVRAVRDVVVKPRIVLSCAVPTRTPRPGTPRVSTLIPSAVVPDVLVPRMP